jgi:hypothetical protein
LERAREEADGVEVYSWPSEGETILHEREEDQGVELFADPDAVIPATALREGSPGRESFDGEWVASDQDADDNRDGGDEEAWD